MINQIVLINGLTLLIIIFTLLSILTISYQSNKSQLDKNLNQKGGKQSDYFNDIPIPTMLFSSFKPLVKYHNCLQSNVIKTNIKKEDGYTLSLLFDLKKFPKTTSNLCFFLNNKSNRLDPLKRSPGIWIKNNQIIVGLSNYCNNDLVDIFHLDHCLKLGFNHIVFVFQDDRLLFYHNGKKKNVSILKCEPLIHNTLVVGPIKKHSIVYEQRV